MLFQLNLFYTLWLLIPNLKPYPFGNKDLYFSLSYMSDLMYKSFDLIPLVQVLD